MFSRDESARGLSVIDLLGPVTCSRFNLMFKILDCVINFIEAIHARLRVHCSYSALREICHNFQSKQLFLVMFISSLKRNNRVLARSRSRGNFPNPIKSGFVEFERN